MKKRTISLALVLATALFTMGAKWAEKPIDDLASIAGAWSGTGSNARGANYTINYSFKQDGSFTFSVIKPGGGSAGLRTQDGTKGPGALWVEGGKLRYKSGKGPWTFTLYENKKGKQKLRGERPDGDRRELTRAK
jgi:hypothetical protein